ncbi:hypothetical protein TRV_01066 [Trichophyton verrucosum HKI 0517]|uniref:Uncharacterized protein n=1 Tax=Trichophyton verrucosum (strain HKI 0517) TaxID=663202 RepID=D4D1W4_TRIVH|nr:uncharacterized protein TRV_01066 [Trichophyton verrucosum HKI 0517]EFE44173.1 hypothetical protein TRV_01066 [Trichophyton verrucosum HKI 0517]
MAGTLELSLERRPSKFYPPSYISHAHTQTKTAQQPDGPTGRQADRQTGRQWESQTSPPCLRRSCSGPAGADAEEVKGKKNNPNRHCGKTNQATEEKIESTDVHSWILVDWSVADREDGKEYSNNSRRRKESNKEIKITKTGHRWLAARRAEKGKTLADAIKIDTSIIHLHAVTLVLLPSCCLLSYASSASYATSDPCPQ